MELNNYHIQIPWYLLEATKKNTELHVRNMLIQEYLFVYVIDKKVLPVLVHLSCHSNVMYHSSLQPGIKNTEMTR